MPVENFVIEFELHGEPVALDAALEQTAYGYRIQVHIGALEVIFEPDEERKLRALISEPQFNQLKTRDRELVAAVATYLEQLRG